jgi:membrane associated rhomboid family serine protease
VLRWVAASEGPWFPSRFAAEAGIPRDSLDEPLAELRLAGLVRVAQWVRGAGQGYEATPEGQALAADAAALVRLGRLVQPAAPPAPAASARAGGDETHETPALAAPDPEAGPADDARPDDVLRPPVVVPVLLVANALWFFVCAVMSVRWGLTLARTLTESHPEILSRFGAVSGPELLRGEWWRLLTSCFVHIGLLHLVGNLFGLAMMGTLAELVWGRLRLLVIYFVSGLAGSALAMALRPDSALAGASGAIWGIQMSLFAWLWTFRRQLPPELASDWFRRLWVVFILNAGISFLPGISWEGHVGGGLAGFAAAVLLNWGRFGDRPRRVAAAVLLAAMPALCVGGLAVAMGEHGTPGWRQLRQRIAADRERAALRRAVEAEAAFNTNVAPRLQALSPEGVKPAEAQATLLLVRAKRSPERVAAVRANVEALKKTADEVMTHTSGEPTGFEAFDRHQDRVRAAVAARARSLDLLLAMLAADGVPTKEAWEAWGASRREADRLWNEVKPK